MLKVIFHFIATSLLFMTTCNTKKMVDNKVTVDNRLQENICLLPNRIRYDHYNTEFTKQRLLFNYSIGPDSTKKMFHTSFCMKRFWESTVVGDTLEILVFDRDVLDANETLEELIFEKKYLRILKFTYSELIDNKCEITIE